MTSLLAAIRAAVRPGAVDLSPEGDEPDVIASISEAPPAAATTEEGQMSDTQNAAAAAITAAADAAAIANATADGRAEGAKAANARLGTILGAEGIRGDGKRMSAALDLATGSPDMAAEAVTAFVTANVAAATVTEPNKQQAYDSRRQAAAPMAAPAAAAPAEQKNQLSASAIYDKRRADLKGA